jgi:hypothetical protein
VNKSELVRYRALHALGVFTLRYSGVPLRSTPGFMLAAASRAKTELKSDIDGGA